MRTLHALIVGCLIMILPLSAFAFPKKKGDKDCLSCHKLEQKEVSEIVKKVVPTGIITGIRMSPIKGVWQIDVDAGNGKHGALFLDFSKKYVIAGQIVPADSLGKKTPEKVDFSKIPLDNAIAVGSPDAKNKVVVFTDPDCPYCRKLHPIMKQIVAERKDVAFFLILNPLPMHKDSPKKVKAILCSKSQKLLDDAFEGKPVPEAPASCTSDAVEKNKQLARSLEFRGTPTLVRDDGDVLSGYLVENKLLDWIDKKQ